MTQESPLPRKKRERGEETGGRSRLHTHISSCLNAHWTLGFGLDCPTGLFITSLCNASEILRLWGQGLLFQLSQATLLGSQGEELENSYPAASRSFPLELQFSL